MVVRIVSASVSVVATWWRSASTSAVKLLTIVRMSLAIFLISSSSWAVKNSQTSFKPVIGSQMRDNRSLIAAWTLSIFAAYAVSWLAISVHCCKIAAALR